MTQTEETPTVHDPAPDATAPSASPARRPAVVVGIIAAALGVAALIAIPSAAAIARSQVISFQDAQPIACSDQDPSIVPHESTFPEDTHYSAITLKAGMDCSLRFFVTNNSIFPARVTGVELGTLNPSGGNALTAASIDGELTGDIATAQGTARFTAGYDLAPGQTHYFEMGLDFVPDSMCLDIGANGFSAVTKAPTVLVSALGIEEPREGQPGGFAMVGSDDTKVGCG